MGYIGSTTRGAFLFLGLFFLGSAEATLPGSAISRANSADSPHLRDIYGTTHTFDEFQDARTKATVIVILDDKCPVVQQIVPKLRALYAKYNAFKRDRAGRPVDFEKYPGDPVRFLGIYVKPDMGAKTMATHALEKHIPFRILHDTDGELVNTYKLSRLSETLVLDSDGNEVYRGAIDDQNVQGAMKPKATQHYLDDVLSHLTSDEAKSLPSPHTYTPAVGCVISSIVSRPKATTSYTYYKDVAPILQKRCEKCHREGEVGPMPFQSYDDAAAYAGMIEEVVLDRRMPPWPGISDHGFRNSEELTEEERRILLDWARGDQAAGNPADAPTPLDWGGPKEWKIGEPDFVFKMPKPQEVPATGVLQYVYVPIAVNGGKGFPEDRYIEAIETRPGVPEVVHHIQIHEYHGPVDKALTPVDQIIMYGLSVENARLLGSYTPGNAEENARIYSRYLTGKESGKTVGMKMSKGANLMLELHYTTNGTAAKDQSSVAIRFAKKKPDLVLETWFPFRKRTDMIIPSNLENHSLQDLYHFGSHTNGKSVLLHGARPHLHSRGKSYRLEIVDPRGLSNKVLTDFSKHDEFRGELLLGLPAWDFSWQHLYRFKEPVLITPQQALLATAYWDNTEHNPRNPDFREDVKWGQQTEQEMFNTLFIYEILKESDPRANVTDQLVSR